MRDPGWDLATSSGGPGFSQEYGADQITTTYHRLGSLDGIEPIVIARHFHHGRPDYIEVSEELRLLFNLFEDRQTGIYYEATDDGSEVEVIKVGPSRADIRTSLLWRYLAARQVALTLQIDSDVWLTLAEDEPIPELPDEREAATERLHYHFYSATINARRPFSRFLGKKIVLPPDRSECGIWPFEAVKEYLSFIIDEDVRGRPVEHSCNPALLANNFGANPGAPHYLTPVFFQREVLRKYYENSNQYEIEDGSVECTGMWHLRADNNHADHVVVFLGDLGRDLPTSEQRHWRHHNVLPEDRELSETAIRRSFLGEWADAELPDFLFKHAYAAANEAWLAAFGWMLFKQLRADDRHVLSSLRLPLSNTANEFDDQVLDLAKLVVDSLNEEPIRASLTTTVEKGDKGLAKFERLLEQGNYPFVARDLALLRTIQGVRSRGAAHRKGKDFDLKQAGLDPQDLHGSFKQLLEQSTAMLTDIAKFADETRAQSVDGSIKRVENPSET
jgi:hypothetical protein